MRREEPPQDENSTQSSVQQPHAGKAPKCRAVTAYKPPSRHLSVSRLADPSGFRRRLNYRRALACGNVVRNAARLMKYNRRRETRNQRHNKGEPILIDKTKKAPPQTGRPS